MSKNTENNQFLLHNTELPIMLVDCVVNEDLKIGKPAFLKFVSFNSEKKLKNKRGRKFLKV